MKDLVPVAFFTLMLSACNALNESSALDEVERVIAKAKQQQLLNAMVYID